MRWKDKSDRRDQIEKSECFIVHFHAQATLTKSNKLELLDYFFNWSNDKIEAMVTQPPSQSTNTDPKKASFSFDPSLYEIHSSLLIDAIFEEYRLNLEANMILDVDQTP